MTNSLKKETDKYPASWVAIKDGQVRFAHTEKDVVFAWAQYLPFEVDLVFYVTGPR